jgi:hypothetical protein
LGFQTRMSYQLCSPEQVVHQVSKRTKYI